LKQKRNYAKKLKLIRYLAGNTGGVVNIGGAQVSLTNWAAGGQSSIALNGLVSLFAHRLLKMLFGKILRILLLV
jgi:hypothetical protein